MTDTDKKKRLAEDLLRYDPTGWKEVAFKALAVRDLIAENEALRDYGKNAAQEAVQYRKERDEAVALLREFTIAGDKRKEMWGAVFAFLAKLGGEQVERKEG